MVASGNHRGHYPPATSAAVSSAASSYGSSNNPGVYSSPANDYQHRHSHHPSHRDGEHRDRSDHLRKGWSIPVSTGRDGYVDYSRDGSSSSCMAAAGSSSNRDSGLQRIPVVCRSSSLPEGPNNHGGGGGSSGLHRSSSGRGGSGGGGRGMDDHRHGDNHHHHLPHPAHHHLAHHHHHHKGSAAAFNGARHPGDMGRNDNEGKTTH